MFSPGVGHTQGDLVVWSATDRVLATGDLFLNRSSPDMQEGPVAGLLRGLDQLLELPIKRVIPGHFEVGDKAALARFRDYVRAVYESAGAAVAEGRAIGRAVGPRVWDGDESVALVRHMLEGSR